MHKLMLVMGLSWAAVASTKDLGVVGAVFPIAEVSLLTEIKTQLASYSWDDLKQDVLKRTALYVDRPEGVTLPRATQNTQHQYLPQLRLKQDIRDIQGHLLWKQGTIFNALHALAYYQPHWLFFNADDPLQLLWVKTQIKPNSKLILTHGALKAATQFLQHPVYFDQGGSLIIKLKIQHLPAVVTRKFDALVIQEIAISKGDPS